MAETKIFERLMNASLTVMGVSMAAAIAIWDKVRPLKIRTIERSSTTVPGCSYSPNPPSPDDGSENIDDTYDRDWIGKR